jgi:hypothetical protein
MKNNFSGLDEFCGGLEEIQPGIGKVTCFDASIVIGKPAVFVQQDNKVMIGWCKHPVDEVYKPVRVGRIRKYM